LTVEPPTDEALPKGMPAHIAAGFIAQRRIKQAEQQRTDKITDAFIKLSEALSDIDKPMKGQ
jgi:hypothetical protein